MTRIITVILFLLSLYLKAYAEILKESQPPVKPNPFPEALVVTNHAAVVVHFYKLDGAGYGSDLDTKHSRKFILHKGSKIVIGTECLYLYIAFWPVGRMEQHEYEVTASNTKNLGTLKLTGPECHVKFHDIKGLKLIKYWTYNPFPH